MNFEQSADAVRNLKSRPSDTELLELYALYKQATVGDCNTDRPGLLYLQARAKWDAWNKVKGVSNEQAISAYILLVQKLIDKYGTN